MEEQSDTPRTDAAVYIASDYDDVVSVDFARDLERALATATRERDEARAALRSIAEDSADRHSSECARAALAATEAP